jgi:hypothetical protein
MPVNAVAVLHAGRQVACNGSGVNSRSSSANGGGSGVSRVAAISTSSAAASSTAGGGSAAEILLELRALREAMSAGAGAFVGQVSASRVASRVASRGTSREASQSASRGASLEPLPVRGTALRGGVRRSISPSPSPQFVPPSNTAAAPGTIDGLSRELRRTTDAYFALVRLTTSERAAAVEREKILNTDLTRARASAEAAAARAARRATSPATGGASSSLSSAAVVAPTTIIHTQNQHHQQQQQQQHDSVAAAAVALDDTRTRIATLSARAFAAEDRVTALSTEREALLDFVQVRNIKKHTLLR